SIQLPLFGPPGQDGIETLVNFGKTLGIGNAGSTAATSITPAASAANPNMPVDSLGDVLLPGQLAPEAFLVPPHAGPPLTAQQVMQIIVDAVGQAEGTRAQIRLPLNNTTRMVISVADPVTGEILGLFRMPDSTIFSIDVAAAKSRNTA